MRFAQGIVKAFDHERIALKLPNNRTCVYMIHARHTHPLADHTEIHAVVLLPRIGGVPGPVQVQDRVVLARPFRHGLDRGVADHEVDHDDDRA